MSNPRVLVPLAEGFEEIEAITIIDVLRRAGIEVVSAALGDNPVRGSHGISVRADTRLDDARGEVFDMIALPGGMPGAEHLRDDARVQEVLRDQAGGGRYVAAICAAPMALGPSKVAEERSVTSYPGFGQRFAHGPYLEKRVVVDGPLITSRGPGTALEFALTVVATLLDAERATELEEAMLVARPEVAYRA